MGLKLIEVIGCRLNSYDDKAPGLIQTTDTKLKAVHEWWEGEI